MRSLFSASLIFFVALIAATAATPDRITHAIDTTQLRAIPGSVHRLAQPQYDRGPSAADLQLDHIMLLTKPSAAQQSDLDQLLADQQNPSSPRFRQWLTPEAYADRFGLSTRDVSKIAAWLASEGLTVQESSQGRNWIAFAGSAALVSKALHTSIHTYVVNGETHFANAIDPSLPEALADLGVGIVGLNNFRAKSQARIVGSVPDYTSNSGTHYLGPGDFSTIYDVKPLYSAGIDGTGQTVVVVGQSDISVNDIRGFRSDFGLPAMDPKLVLYGTDPGVNGDQVEANLDIEWAGAIAQKATIYYVYGQDAFEAWSVAVGLNLAPVVSISFGGCEFDNQPAASFYQAIAQQGNAQGITTLNASGDSGGAECDPQGDQSVATFGLSVSFPSDIPEVTGVGGSMFNEGSGNYWSATNSSTLGSALAYIPEIVWNQSSLADGLGASGGGASGIFNKPAWQAGPGVPADGLRDVPDIALSAAGHDPYLITYNSGTGLFAIAGTSCATPSMAGIIALLNQYQVKQGYQKTAGLGNINPQLYRLALSTPAAFHDIVSGSNAVPCELGTRNCVNGTVGYNAGPGYDQATGLGSVDANVLVTSWNSAASPSTTHLTISPSKATLNDTVTATVTVSATNGKGTPTGTVSLGTYGSAALAPVNGVQTASIAVPAWMLPTGASSLIATYSGDAAFSGSSALAAVQITLPTTANVAAVVPVPGENPVYTFPSGNEPPAWQTTLTLTEKAGVPALLTGFTIDGQAQSVAQYFPSANIPAKGTLATSVVFHNLAVPVTKVFGFTGTDAGGNQWSRQMSLQFVGAPELIGFNPWAVPLNVLQNPASSTCPLAQRIIIDGAGFGQQIVGLFLGSVQISPIAVFGTTRIAPWGSVQGTVCWGGEAVPSTDVLTVQTEDDFGDVFTQSVNVTFSGPAASAIQLSAALASLAIQPATIPGFQPPVTLSVGLSDRTQPWTATVYPANETTAWLQLSQYSGTGPANITLSTLPTGFGPGAYKATIVLQSPLAIPESVSIPVMWVNTGSPQVSSSAPVVSSVNNAFSLTPGASPGMLMAVYGSQLANTTQIAPATLDNSLAGVSVTVNGWPAPILYASPSQLNIQVPYEASAGQAVLGVNNNGQVGGYMFPVSPSSPGIVSVNGMISPSASAKQGAYATMYVTGVGDVSEGLPTGISVPAGTAVTSLPQPLLPLSVTVGGTPALIQFAGLPPGIVGLTQVNFIVPPTVAPGVQLVVVTVNGVSSAPAAIMVTQ